MIFGSENMLKGRIAEAIVEDMLKEAGFQVYRFGYESVIQNLVQNGVTLKENEISRKIKSMPDFIVINKKSYAHFVEVKFRSGQPDPESPDCKSLAETWPESLIIFVCKHEPHFWTARICDFVDTQKNYQFLLATDIYIGVGEYLVKKYSKRVIDSYGV